MEKRVLDTSNQDAGIRLNKFLSDAGLCSRREADRLVTEQRVRINDVVAVMGQRVFEGDKVSVDGREVGNTDTKLELIAFNKPRGIECTTSKSVKNNIVDYIDYPVRIYPIGRLDKDSQGLILLTNDGSLVNEILRGRYDHEKEYEVIVDKPVTDEFTRNMSGPVHILDTVTKPSKVRKISKCKFNIIITQGLNRQIRRMCEVFGYKVRDLKRIRIMNIELGSLPTGQYRSVTKEEYTKLLSMLKGK